MNPLDKVIGIFSIKDVIPYVGEYITNRYDKRYKVDMFVLKYRMFRRKGIKCACCNRRGQCFKLHANNRFPDRGYFNLYGRDTNGQEFLMTVDHIIPMSKGGLESICNVQPMCWKCNQKKADKI